MRAVPFLGLAVLCGCWDLLPASRDPLRDAEHTEQVSCAAAPETYPSGLFDPASVISVAPLYFLRSERGDQASHLLGATLVLRPFPGVGAEELARLLRCHGARAQLGRPGEPSVPNDPYWLPGHVVRVSAELDDGALTTHLEGRDFDAAQAILARAEAYGKR